MAVLAAAAALTACNTIAPIQNVENVSVSSSSNKPLSPVEVRAAMVRAGAASMDHEDAGPGTINGTLILRTHTAEVQIPYTATSYGIVYKSSVNLQESGQDPPQLQRLDPEPQPRHQRAARRLLTGLMSGVMEALTPLASRTWVLSLHRREWFPGPIQQVRDTAQVWRPRAGPQR